MGHIQQFPGMLPPMPTVARVLGQFDRDKLGAAIEVMIALLDIAEPDPEAEPITWPEDVRAVDREHLHDDSEAAGDEDDAAWIEWAGMNRHQRRGANQTAGQEGDEADGDEQDGDYAEDEPCTMFAAMRSGPGCRIADPREDGGDSEVEQMADDVPMLPVVSAEHNVFTDSRVMLGLSNLQSSFRTGGEGVRSADTGRMHCSPPEYDDRPGQPV